MSLKLFIIPLITFYLAFQLQQTNATFLVESATGKALIQSACSASDSPPACYAVLNPVANNPDLNPTDICTVALQAASNIAKVTHGMLNVSLTVTAQIARDPSVRQSVVICAKEYAQVLDLIDKSATALTQKVDEDKVPEYLSSAIAAIAKCDACAIKVGNMAVQITNKNVDCSKMLKNALGIYKVFAEYIENPSHDPKEITGSGTIGGNVDINAGGSASGIIGLSAPTMSPTPKTNKDDASGGKSSNDDNGMEFSFAKKGEFRKEFSASSNGNVQPQTTTQSSDNSAGSESTPSHISTNMKFSGLGLGLGEHFKGLFLNNAEDSDSESSAGLPQSGSSAGEPQSGSSAGTTVNAGMKFGLGLGLGEHFKGLFSNNAEDANSGSNAGVPEIESSAGASQSGSSAGAPINAGMKFGLGLGLGEHFKGLFSNNAEDPNSGSSAGVPQIESSTAGASQSGSSAGAPVNAGMKFSLSDIAKTFTSSKKHKEADSPSPAPANPPSSSDGANAPSTDGSTDAPADDGSSSESADAPDDGVNSYTDDDATDDADSPSPSSGEVSLKYSISHLIPDT